MLVKDDVGIVAIGRNEGERLRLCLLSARHVNARVYVDSGSTDGSQVLARQLGFDLVDLPVPPNFTAARARNAGLERLLQLSPKLVYVQMIDGDCELAPGWLEAARRELEKSPELAAVFGRRRERNPNLTVYNMICDDEWDVPVGDASSCGGDAMFRVAALLEANGYTESLIAGEEPDLCLRLRRNHWKIRRIPAEMTIHDVALYRFSQWWKRAKRSGHAFAELVSRHGSVADPHWRRQIASIVFWPFVALSLGLSAASAAALNSTTLALIAVALTSVIAIQVIRMAVRRYRDGMPLTRTVQWACLLMIGKVAQLQGLVQFHRNRLTRTNSNLIEYKR